MADKKIERKNITVSKGKINIPSSTVRNNPKANENMHTPGGNMSTPCDNMRTPCTSVKGTRSLKIKK